MITSTCHQVETDFKLFPTNKGIQARYICGECKKECDINIVSKDNRMNKADIKRIIITEYPDKGWLMNIDKFNDESDVEIPEELAKHILELQK